MSVSVIRVKKGLKATFETIYSRSRLIFEGENVRYEFVRKVEDQVKSKRSFTELSELFKFLGDYLDPVSLR